MGFFIGGLSGAKPAGSLSHILLEKIFRIALRLISLKMLFAGLSEGKKIPEAGFEIF